jgi:predicted nucleic acid-binding protein
MAFREKSNFAKDSRVAWAMMTAVDTNVIVALWDPDALLSGAANVALDEAVGRGRLVICGPVFAELMALPRRNESFLDGFLRDTGISVDWELDESIWRTADQAFQGYASRRRHQPASPRRILADFLIGAHAFERKCRFLTLDQGLYRAAFPRLEIQTI